MDSSLVSYIIVFSLSAITVWGDFLIKTSSIKQGYSGWKYLLLAIVVYGLTAVGFFFVLRDMKLFTAGAFYAVGVVLLVTIMSVFYFHEKISSIEILGIFFAITSLVLLANRS